MRANSNSDNKERMIGKTAKEGEKWSDGERENERVAQKEKEVAKMHTVHRVPRSTEW